MKKSIAAHLIGSALLLPNNNSVEASYSGNDVQVKEIQCVQYIGWGVKQFHFNNSKLDKINNAGYSYKWNNPSFQKQEVKAPAPAAPVAKPEPAKAKPVEQPKPAAPTPAKPVEQTKPTTPVAKPAPTAPTAKPAPAPAVPVKKPVEATQDASVSAIEKAVLDLTNAERQKAGLQPLQTDSKLMNSARQKSTDMATKNYFSHTSPTYGSPFDQMKANGVSYKSAAENIAMGQQSAEEVVKGWMESPGHRENIIDTWLYTYRNRL